MITRLESAGERGQEKLLPSSASKFLMCLAAELYRPAVLLATEALNRAPAKVLRRTGVSLGRLQLAKVGPLGRVLNLFGREGLDLGDTLDLGALALCMTVPFITKEDLMSAPLPNKSFTTPNG